MSTSISFSQALDGYELAFLARKRSLHTLAEYQNTFRKFQEFLGGDPPIASIDHHQVERFLAAQTVSTKTVLNYHIGLSALWTWAVKEHLVSEHIVHLVERPSPKKTKIVPFTEDEARAILGAVSRSRVFSRPGKRACDRSLLEADRNRAIILVLLDTGLRVSELCDLPIQRVDLRFNKRISIPAMKSVQDRHIPISPRTAQAVWKYLSSRPDARVSDPLFASKSGNAMDRHNIGNMLEAAGERAGVTDVHPHRFRHTFAITFLRNGGDVYTLQEILGHTTLEMVRTYLEIANSDLERAHRRASPVDNWRL
jgi:integrase/recombinase XerD